MSDIHPCKNPGFDRHSAMTSTGNPPTGLSFEELEAMAQLAWRNNHRCIGRLFWQSLECLDERAAACADEVFEACVRHLRHSTNGGRIRNTVTVFHPAERGDRGIRIWNRQLIRYAGYRLENGSVLGDPEQVGMTAKVMEMGWRSPEQKSPFDVLPLVIEYPGEKPRWYELPEDAVLQIEITHPDYPWFADMNLKWHALPAVSDMALVGNGLRFTAAPFSGYYMATEIACRNFGDEKRYDLLPRIARQMGLDVNSKRSLWKDRAMIELNAAVLHSYRRAGVSMVDHHTASEQFMRHVANEEICGRDVPGDWSWLVPPLSGSACPVFHRYYSSKRPEPAFVDQPRAW
jgi:nitric-oxide synthase